MLYEIECITTCFLPPGLLREMFQVEAVLLPEIEDTMDYYGDLNSPKSSYSGRKVLI